MAIGAFINKLTNKFTDTVFYKQDSEIKHQINALNKLLQQYPSNDYLQRKLKLCRLGEQGEREIEFELKNANIGVYVLHDVNLEYEGLRAQIDYIIITSAKVYFVECKNLVGNITIDDKGNFIREYQYGKRTIKEGIYSPVTQAQRHVEIFKKIWKDRNTSFLDKTIRMRNWDSWYIPLVVLANSKCVIDDRYAPKEIKKIVIKSDRLVDYLKKDIEGMDKDLLNSQKEMHNIAYSIMANYNMEINRDYEKEYSNGMKRMQEQAAGGNNEIKNNLLEYRKSKAKEKNIPAYYIFNNNELDRILEVMPRTRQELADSRILTDVKLKLHGEEIIKIING